MQEEQKFCSLYIERVIPHPPAHGRGFVERFFILFALYLFEIFSFVAFSLQSIEQYIWYETKGSNSFAHQEQFFIQDTP
jgi:hypothetical protein